ncbi:MAG: phenylacetate--CoA ligase family protein [Gammaproteobacteria bacterium]|nr:phenylacetate--CoA ligase family protein [Gammaproteobacteria bacterium]
MNASSDRYTTFVSGVLFPLHERLKGHATLRIRRELEQSQWWPPERLHDLRQRRLQALLRHAAVRVPYYGTLFQRIGLDPAAGVRTEQLSELPFLTKDDIRANSDALKARDARHLARFNTGGSSGEPLIFFIGRERVSHDVAAKWRATRWWGVDIGDREAVIWGSPIELGTQDRLRMLRDRLLRTTLLPAFEMSEARLDGFVAALRTQRPRMLFGYPSALAHIARHARRRGVRLDDLGIKVAFVTSEMLYDDQRRDIEAIFDCPVANGYGGRDAGFIAHQCPAGGMHLTAEDLIVETIGSDGRPVSAGEPGEIVVTHLATRDFPFIRYRTGDIGVLDDRQCPCGRTLPLLREVQGRSTDFVVARDGTVMHGLALIYVVRDVPGVVRFRIIQESLERTRVLLETNAQFAADAAERIRAGIAARLGAGVEVPVECVDRIPDERSGKFRYIVSQVHAARGVSARGRVA